MPKDNLIKYFSRKCVDPDLSVETLLGYFGADNREQLLEIKDYQKMYEVVERNYNKLQRSVKRLDIEGQVQNCLALLHDYRVCLEDIDVLSKLIRNDADCLYTTWNSDGKQLYDKAYEIVTGWQDYFLSYTNRNIPEVNNFVIDYIGNCFKQHEFNADKDKRNLVADLIEKWLNQEGLISFYDNKNLIIGDEIKDEIEQYCKSCFVFVQVVEKVMFTKPEGRQNWCFKEYTHYQGNDLIDDGNKVCCFIAISGDESAVFPVSVFTDYAEWHKDVKGRIKISLGGIEYTALKRQFNLLAKEILRTKKAVLNKLLGDYC